MSSLGYRLYRLVLLYSNPCFAFSVGEINNLTFRFEYIFKTNCAILWSSVTFCYSILCFLDRFSVRKPSVRFLSCSRWHWAVFQSLQKGFSSCGMRVPRWDYTLEISEHAVSSKTELNVLNILTRQQSQLRATWIFPSWSPRCCLFSRACATFLIRRVFESGLFQYFRGGISDKLNTAETIILR